MSEVCDCVEIRLRVQRHGDVESLRTGGFDPTGKAQLLQQRREVERCSTQHVQLTFVGSVAGRIEIEDADVGLVKVRRSRSLLIIRNPALRHGATKCRRFAAGLNPSRSGSGS